MKPVHIHQIFYDEASRAAVDPRFIPLDNMANARPDWREYWPMRNFLTTQALDEDAYYGFFSPKFHAKTGLGGAAVLDFIEATDADVYVFSPYVEQASFFLNVFEHGEANHPGMLPAMQQFVTEIGLAVDLRTFVCVYANSVFSNYFVAKAAFWREWLVLGERLFALAESGQGPLAQLLNAPAKYHQQVGAVGLKVFIMERLVSLLLLFNKYQAKAYDPFALTRTPIPAGRLDHEMRIANALKLAFLQSGDERYIQSFVTYRDAVIGALSARPGI